MFYYRGAYASGLVCDACKGLWENPEDPPPWKRRRETVRDYNAVIAKACADHGINLIDAAVEGVPALAERFGITESWLYGSSYLVGDDIVLGVYDADQVPGGIDFLPGKVAGQEIRAAAFFHEIGHRLQTGQDLSTLGQFGQMSVEANAWERGFEAAKTYGIESWSENVAKYVQACLSTYTRGIS